MRKIALLVAFLMLMAVPAFAGEITHGKVSGNVAAAGAVAGSTATVCGTGYASAGGGAVAIAVNGRCADFAYAKAGGGSEAMACHGYASAGQISAAGAITGGFRMEWTTIEFGRPCGGQFLN